MAMQLLIWEQARFINPVHIKESSSPKFCSCGQPKSWLMLWVKLQVCPHHRYEDLDMAGQKNQKEQPLSPAEERVGQREKGLLFKEASNEG